MSLQKIKNHIYMKKLLLLFLFLPCLTQVDAQPDVFLQLKPDVDNPRNSEGDFITLKNKQILFIYTHYTGKSDSDHAPAYLAGRYSKDGEKTWTQEDTRIVENEGTMNVMSVSLLRLQNGNIALFYLRKNSESDCIPLMRISTDEARTWSDPVTCITDKKGYFVLNNSRVIQLNNGRLLMPVAQHNDETNPKLQDRAKIWCYYSDDSGTTWHCSKEVPNPSGVISQEPGVVELKDGSIMMIIRASGGFQQISHSHDKGITWTPMFTSTIRSPLSPATIARIPTTGDLMLVWNNNNKDQLRTPLTVAISKDEGKTWQYIKNIENNPDGCYCYIAVYFYRKKVLLAYCAGKGEWDLSNTNITGFPVKWLYQ